jgi:predicted  nucleic acid-binding Zn-ribbon protein
MHPCTCIECGIVFEAKTMFATVCSPKCSQRRYRKTEKGKASVLKFNTKVKRPDIDKKCTACGSKFITARETQELCSSCSGTVGNYEALKKHRIKYPVKSKARGRFNKRIQRGSVKKEPCYVCMKEAEGHHPDYKKPLEVIWLCKEHHVMIHSLDYLFN